MAGQSGSSTRHLVSPYRLDSDRRSGPTWWLWLSSTLVVGLLLTGLAACAADEVPQAQLDDPQLVTGQDIYSRNCAGCHGGAGQGGTGPALADGASVQRYPDTQDHIAIIANGQGQMPAFGGKLTDEEIEAVVRYNREVL